MVRFGLVSSGLVWSILVRSGLVLSSLVYFDQVRSGRCNGVYSLLILHTAYGIYGNQIIKLLSHSLVASLGLGLARPPSRLRLPKLIGLSN